WSGGWKKPAASLSNGWSRKWVPWPNPWRKPSTLDDQPGGWPKTAWVRSWRPTMRWGNHWLIPAVLVLMIAGPGLQAEARPVLKLEEKPTYLQIDTDALQARITKKGYVSGIAGGSFLDRKTGAREVGFGLHIMDFLMAPGWRDDGYPRTKKVHGNLPKHYI